MASRVLPALNTVLTDFRNETKALWFAGDVLTLLNPLRIWNLIWGVFYVVSQTLIIALFSPPLPNAPKVLRNPYGKIAVIGAGITGVSSAAHALAHGFEVVIFEQAPRDKLGGIWANVNTTSSLQINSLIYRFHPSVMWTRGFPHRDEILAEITRIWKEYNLDSRTRFDTKVTSVDRAPKPNDGSWDHDSHRTRWIINDGSEGAFDAIIVTVGTCGDPNWIKLPGMPDQLGIRNRKKKTSPSPGPDTKHSENGGASVNGREEFKKVVIHSCQLDSPAFQLKGGEKVVVIGSGASGVEAVETVLDRFGGGKHTADQLGEFDKRKKIDITMIARDDKWIIPRNIVVDTLISCQPFGREMPLSFVWENLLRKFQYQGVEKLVPQDKGLYEGTPVCNDKFLKQIKEGLCNYVRGAPVRLTTDGVIVTGRKKKPGRSTKVFVPQPGDAAVDTVTDGAERLYKADVIVLATGYQRPSLDFLPQDLFPDGYQRPDLYLQNFSTEDWSILMTNSSYVNAIGTVGHFHIGIYTRILLTLLLDPAARPEPKDMKLWVDTLRFLKRGATGGALGFFTYMELTMWLVLFHVLRPDRLRWMFFILNGWGVYAQK